MKKLLTIQVTDKHSAPSKSLGWADHVVSLVDPGTNMAGRFHRIRHHQEIFDDVENEGSSVNPDGLTIHGYKPPTIENIRNVLDFTSEFLDGQNIIVHCHAGICRSTAMAALIHCQAGFSGEDALKRVERQRPQLWPNTLVVKLGDQILGLDGELIEAVQAFQEANKDLLFWDEAWQN